jgi:hypothetical protein
VVDNIDVYESQCDERMAPQPFVINVGRVVSKSICVTQILSAAYLISHSKLSATIATQPHVVKKKV